MKHFLILSIIFMALLVILIVIRSIVYIVAIRIENKRKTTFHSEKLSNIKQKYKHDLKVTCICIFVSYIASLLVMCSTFVI